MQSATAARRWGFHRALAAIVACGSVTCASGRTSVVQTSAEFKAGAHRVGIVGLFRNGRLDQPAWEVIASRVAKPLGSVDCASAFSRAMREAEPETYASLDRRVKDEGLNNEVLSLLLPHTEADLLLIVEGRDPRVRAPRERKAPTDLPGRPVRSGYARSATVRSAPEKSSLSSGTGYSLTASLYSVSLHKLVARADTHDAVTLEAAADELAQNMAPLVVGSSCARWKWLDHWHAEPALGKAVPPSVAAEEHPPRAETGEAGAPAQ